VPDSEGTVIIGNHALATSVTIDQSIIVFYQLAESIPSDSGLLVVKYRKF